MRISAWIDRLDDWINPIVVKELRQAVKSRLIAAMLLLFLALQLLIVALFLGLQEIRTGDSMNSRAGNELFTMLQAIMLGTCMVLIPTYAAVRLSGERSDSNVDLLFISTLRPTSIIAGKFFSALVLAMLVFSCCAPFMTFAYLLRGIDIPTIFFVLGIDLLAVLLSTQAALFVAAIPATRAFKVFLFFFGFLGLCWIFAGMVAGTSELIRGGVSSEMPGEFWAVMGTLALASLFTTGLLFCWSVSLISPPSANRALVGRLFLVGSWLILGAACLGLSRYFWAPGLRDVPISIWMGCSIGFLSLQFLISINERDSWGPRVTRTIPRWWPLRFLAFLFYSGAAGGTCLSVICMAATLGLDWWWHERIPTLGFHSEVENVWRVFAALALYVFCYGTSAVLIRFYLLSERVRSVFTWVLVLMLVAVGCTLPWSVGFLVYGSRFARYGELPWWLLANPFGAIYEVGSERADTFTEICFLFLAAWALIILVLSIPWGVQQFVRFHPPARRPRSKAELQGGPPPSPPESATDGPTEIISSTPVEAG